MKTKIFKKILLLSIGILGISFYWFIVSENEISGNINISEKNIDISDNIISSGITIPEDNKPISENIISNKLIIAEKNTSISTNNFSEFPVRLKIPKIWVDTDIIDIGITPTGALDTPKDIKHVGLYSLWTIPWEKGSAVINGHYGWINKKPAVFNNLSKLKKWDEIYFHDKNGNIITFIVNKIKIYDQYEVTTDIFNSNDWKAHLNIITCEWVWDKTKKSYNNRLVVFSDKLIKE